ncbi:MAG: class I SAM-dependent methyltransferase [Pseudohongiellaceae bacterium]
MRFLSKRETRRRLLQGLDDKESIAEQLSQWFQTPLGQVTLACELAAAKPIIERMFGYHILQIGGSEEAMLIEHSPIAHKIMFSSERRPRGRNPVADNEELPLPNDSIDAVVVHHGLDFTRDSHALLRELTRVLRPGGQMLVIGFNPLSQWGMIRLLRRRFTVPWQGRFIARHRLLDWFKLLDLRVEQSLTGLHYPPFNVSKLLEKSQVFESFGNRVKSPFGGAYLLSCVKQHAPITPILPKWRPVRTQRGVVPVADNFRSKLH